MADEQISQFTNGNTPNAGDFVGGYLGASPGVAGSNRRWSFTNIATRISAILGLGTIVTQDADDVALTGGAIDGATIGGSTPAAATVTTLSATDNVTIANGKAIRTDTTTAHTMIFQAYDVDGTAFKTFMTLTNGNTPSLAISAPSGGSITIDGAVIGGTTAAAATVTTAVANTSVTSPIISGGSSGSAGVIYSYPTTASKGNLQLKAIDNAAGNFVSIISNDDGNAQDTTYTVPVSPTATTKFIISDFNGTQVLANGAFECQYGDISAGGNFINTAVAKTLVLKQGADGKTGTVTLDGVTPVSVSNTSITANSGIIFTLKTVSGTVGAYPAIQTITPSTGFTVAGTALDASVYNYHIIESAA